MYILLFTLLALIGAADTIYLISKRKKSQAPICPLHGDCAFVLNSKYNKTFGVHNDVVGLLYFILAGLSPLFIVLALLIGGTEPNGVDFASTPFSDTLLFGTIIGVYLGTLLAFLMTLRLLFLQFFVIKKMCFWCLLSSTCVILMTAILVIPLFEGEFTSIFG